MSPACTFIEGQRRSRELLGSSRSSAFHLGQSHIKDNTLTWTCLFFEHMSERSARLATIVKVPFNSVLPVHCEQRTLHRALNKHLRVEDGASDDITSNKRAACKLICLPIRVLLRADSPINTEHGHVHVLAVTPSHRQACFYLSDTALHVVQVKANPQSSSRYSSSEIHISWIPLFIVTYLDDRERTKICSSGSSFLHS